MLTCTQVNSLCDISITLLNRDKKCGNNFIWFTYVPWIVGFLRKKLNLESQNRSRIDKRIRVELKAEFRKLNLKS